MGKTVSVNIRLSRTTTKSYGRVKMTSKYFVAACCGIGLLTSCAPSSTPPTQWSCRNTAVEISCQGTDCTVAPPGEFTPMELTFDSNGKMSLCAYSGCWSGQADKVSTGGNMFTVIGLNLPWSGTDGAPAEISATINMKSALAFVLTDDYAHPMSCTAEY